MPSLHSFPTRRSSDLLPSTEETRLSSRQTHGPVRLHAEEHRSASKSRGFGSTVALRCVSKDEGSGACSGQGWTGGLGRRSEEHTSELQSHSDLVCRLL